MNYIKHLTSVMIKFTDDDRLNTAHVSLYLALFQIWNLNRFQNPISINRAEAMKISKIGSKGTYHRCINELSTWSYLQYVPSHNPLKGSVVHMFIFETSSEQLAVQVEGQHLGQLTGLVSEPLINNTNKENISNSKNFVVPTLEEIKEFFKNDAEAEKFLNYYNSNGWLVGGRTKMKDWKAAARNWQLNQKRFNPEAKTNHYQTNEDKDYSIPL